MQGETRVQTSKGSFMGKSSRMVSFPSFPLFESSSKTAAVCLVLIWHELWYKILALLHRTRSGSMQNGVMVYKQ